MGIKQQLGFFKNNWLLVLLILLVLGFFSGFGGVTDNFSSKAYGGSLDYVSSPGMMAESSARYGGVYYDNSDFAPEVEERIVIETSSMSVEIERGSFEDKEARAKQIIDDNKGFLLNENSRRNGQDKFAYFTGYYSIRVPVDNYDKALDELKEIGEVTSFNEQTTDITGSYVSLLDDLEFQKNKLDRYKELFDKASKVEDQINLLNYITNQERTVKSLENRINQQDQRIEYATISLTLNEEPSNYSNIRWVKFSSLVKSFVESIGSLLSFIFIVVPWAIAIGLVWWIISLIKRRK